ncbi:hypothetical protein Kpol_1069p9 [Vanderwaltozyma polyspora DSM 70294]|uniref:inorganic diphosphatase n=1 Tax=Vanderwaltozyma polyspora (strain ATCC 22028 / DSM 70294 / BCRC 21397 / CBS 2163 / NBRC 10782 / NRRL Y-8283 / UCD 57-17) TaxID=436907 RepID=A7TRB9_VANPO|nr:uncharacterized protein Kpol_1069p9 [Vanderwaltozyma polyspora DSM 70294]EDO15187.1 hypothetical protein Kpol_1069p9 [Vanderwaltozyma polyspora DSM 70294]
MFRGSAVMKRLLQAKQILSPERNFHSASVGTKYTSDYKKYLKLPNGEIGSYFHDVPLNLNESEGTVQMVTEVTRWSNAKFEISKEDKYNPIVQDVKNGQVRFVKNLFPFKGYIHNYGAIPQTWEDSTEFSKINGTESLKGDNDPLDCCEIGSELMETGQISTVKVLGSLALIDDGELDWKVIVINVNDTLAPKLNNIRDVDIYFPGLLDSTRTWFRNYKIPDGKPANEFAFDGQYKDKDETIEIIKECYESWKRLESGMVKTQDTPLLDRAGSGVSIEHEEKEPARIPSSIDKWYYL